MGRGRLVSKGRACSVSRYCYATGPQMARSANDPQISPQMIPGAQIILKLAHKRFPGLKGCFVQFDFQPILKIENENQFPYAFHSFRFLPNEKK